MDLLVHMQRPPAEQLQAGPTTTSAEVRAAVDGARERQAPRLAGTGVSTNAEMTAGLMREAVHADAAANARLRVAYTQGTLSARGHQRVLRVARTIADLEGSDRVSVAHVNAALSLRDDQVLEGAAAA
jgi:magnesium chelatase family protein